MRNPVIRLLSALFTFLLVMGSPSADEPHTIIPEWKASIQLISTAGFNSWPGVSGISPVDISAADGRTWLVWPGSIINLSEDGKMDEQTLLTLFASRTADWGDRNWTPEKGVVCSDGFWRGFILNGELIARLNLQTGEVITSPWEKAFPDSVYPANDGNLIIFTGTEAALVNGDYRPLEFGPAEVSQMAVSTQYPFAAWKDVVDDKLRIADFSRSLQVSGIDSGNLPGQRTWGLAWAGDKLIMAYPGELLAVDLQEGGTVSLEKLTDDRLPGRWYRLRGGKDRLIIQSPETGMLGIIRAGDTEISLPDGADNREISTLLESFTLSAGNYLEGKGELVSAEKFYGWVLPFVREQRSRYPLEMVWPELESELTTRRLNLRSRLN